jgi:drug/metabolite transporter (DMT)-like permease
MKRHYFVLAIGVVAVSFAAVLIKLADAPSLVIAAYRMALASLVIVPLALARSGNELRRLPRKSVMLGLGSGAFLALHFSFWVASLSYTSVATSVILVTTTPIFVAIASYFLFHEKLTKQVGAGIAISLAGSIVIGYGNWQVGANSLFGAALAMLGALAVVGYLIIGRRLMRNMGLLSYASLSYGSAALFLTAAALVAGRSFFGYSSDTYLMLVLLALVPQVIGHSSVNWALRFISATLVTVAVLGEPVGATALAFFILKEAPSLTEVGGGLLIMTGIFVAFRKPSEQG